MFKNILILYQKEFQRLKHNPSALMAVGLLILMAFLVNIEAKTQQKNNALQTKSPCIVVFNQNSQFIAHLKRNINQKLPVKFVEVKQPITKNSRFQYDSKTDCAAEITFDASKKSWHIVFRSNKKNHEKVHGFSRWLLSSLSAYYSDLSIDQSVDVFKNKKNNKPDTGFDLGNAKSKAMVSAMLIFSAQYFICCALFISLTSNEKEKGVLQAISLTTASPWQILIAKILFHLTLSVVAVLMMIAILKPTWFLSTNAIILVGPTVILSSISLISVAAMIVCFSKTQTSASLSGFCYLMLIGVVFALSQNFAGFAMLKALMFENHTISLYGILFDDSPISRREHRLESVRYFLHLIQLIVISPLILIVSSLCWRKFGYLSSSTK